MKITYSIVSALAVILAICALVYKIIFTQYGDQVALSKEESIGRVMFPDFTVVYINPSAAAPRNLYDIFFTVQNGSTALHFHLIGDNKDSDVFMVKGKTFKIEKRKTTFTVVKV